MLPVESFCETSLWPQTELSNRDFLVSVEDDEHVQEILCFNFLSLKHSPHFFGVPM